MPKDVGVPGNTLQEQAVFDRMVNRVGAGVLKLEHDCSKTIGAWGQVKSIRFRAPTDTNPEWLVVIAVATENGGVVGFHSSDTMADAIVGLGNRIRNGSLKWKEDEYA